MERTVVRIEGGQALGQRQRQEDAWGGGEMTGGCWAAVADGLGGHREGDRASRTAIDAIREHMRTMPLPADADWSAWLESGVMSAHRAVE
ncbi:PP2C family protein-serine/threonine phosphatase, partial [Sulfobacillus harzensis]